MRAQMAMEAGAQPAAHLGRQVAKDWERAMRAGNFLRAWAMTDAFLRGPLPDKHTGPRHLQRIWRGEPLAGRHVLVRCYHGLGDTLQFIRFAAPLRAIAREVTVWCQPELMKLVATAAGIDRLMPLHDGTPDLAFDVDLEVMELAHALHVCADEVGRCIPYLACEPAQRPRTDRFRIGIVTEVGDWASQRAIPLSALEPLLREPQFELLSLRPGTDVEGLPIGDVSSPSIDALAGRLYALDAIVTVDTMVAHLAGALGRPVATLLNYVADWRWGSDVRSVWYPTMRLFRQPALGDWSTAIDALMLWLRAKAARNVRDRT